MEKAKKNFVKRAMIAVVIFFIPTLLQLIFNVFDSIAIDGCMDKFN